ncbi:hypothetical protein Acy02nite_92080 [Actinoplanes cyaneus]|uniref:Uncharacterized protein n=1 Tax=Actinoplanes cyaneus TaxID=52696 RepID=A0A919IVM9_9ACTN|nr:hypothetical protein [Actinoplanes cyaneus]MCW2144614.1 hypothetical protein [Actinoplanes cyaneus]GID71327.1 hypothetical protein Acy02nite_92080 [Actinoplanes cyaneus]
MTFGEVRQQSSPGEQLLTVAAVGDVAVSAELGVMAPAPVNVAANAMSNAALDSQRDVNMI